VKSRTIRPFWVLYRGLPAEARGEADKAFELFQQDPFHPSLQFKEVSSRYHVWSARIGLHWRVLGYRNGANVTWYWIGSHAEYDQLVKRLP
jgi:hypothetical protein